jgi:hypothetical protein
MRKAIEPPARYFRNQPNFALFEEIVAGRVHLFRIHSQRNPLRGGLRQYCGTEYGEYVA